MRSTAVVLVLAFANSAASAASWTSLDQTPPGTPAAVTLDAAASTTSQTFLDITIHGFWSEDVFGPDGSLYKRIEVPGLPGLNQLGAPDVPVVRGMLGIATDAPAITVLSVAITDDRAYSNVLVWPQVIEALADGVPEQFTRDQNIYGVPRIFPADPLAKPVGSLGEVIPPVVSGSYLIQPVRTNPVQRTLLVAARMRVGFTHTGKHRTPSPALTTHRTMLLRNAMNNWDEVTTYYPTDTVRYGGEFLFIYERSNAEEIQPLIDQKAARGFTIATNSYSGGLLCDEVRAIIEQWYASTPVENDHYCLLVGSTSDIRTCGPFDMPTDDFYGDADADGIDDLDPEVYVGRLSVGSEADLTTQVQKILAYESGDPYCEPWLQKALLVASDFGPDPFTDNGYRQCQESVRAGQWYSQVLPQFDTLYAESGATNSAVDDAINEGRGIVCYRGAGGAGWVDWNPTHQSFLDSSVLGLANDEKTPVVWDFGKNLFSFGVPWMSHTSGGGVAHYGPKLGFPSKLGMNELDRQMFRAVFDLGFTRHAQAIRFAENEVTEAVDASNAHSFALLGDPEMTIRRTDDVVPCLGKWDVIKPDWLLVGCPLGCPPIDIHVQDRFSGAPAPGVRVSFVKYGQAGAAGSLGVGAGAQAQVIEAQDNRYTLADGWAHIPTPPLTLGHVVFTVTDDFGNVHLDSIPVLSPTEVTERLAAGGAQLRASTVSGSGDVLFTFGSGAANDAVLHVSDANGRVVLAIPVPRGAADVAWRGVDRAGRRAARGLYIATLTDDRGSASARVLLTR